jgi:hypothetical protein
MEKAGCAHKAGEIQGLVILFAGVRKFATTSRRRRRRRRRNRHASYE